MTSVRAPTSLSRPMWLFAAVGVAALLAACSTLENLNPFSSASKVKMAELQGFPATATLTVGWQGTSGAARDYVFTPAVVGASVYVAGADGALARYDDGREVWRVNAGQRLSGGVAANGTLVAVGTPKGEVLTFSADGKPLWKAVVTSEVLSAPAVVQGMVIVRSGDNRIFGLDILDGKRRWLYQRAAPPLTLRTFAGVTVADRTVLVGFPGGKLVAINASNGAALWEATVALPRGATELERVADVSGVPVVAGRNVCAAAYQGRVACFDRANGNSVWARDMSSSVGVDIDSRYLYVTDEKSAVHALDRSSGASVWRNDKLNLRGVTRPLALGNHVAVADSQGVVHLLRSEDGAFAARVNTDGSAILAAPVAADGGLIVQTRSGTVYGLASR